MGNRGPPPSVTPEEIFSVFIAQDDPCEPLTTQEVAEELNIAQRTALKQLQRVENEVPIKSKTVGASARVWWVPYRDVPTDN